MMVKKFLFGVALGILGVILFSSKAVMVKLAYNYEVDAITMLLLRMLFSFPFYVVIAYLHRNDAQEIKTTRKDYLWLVFFGLVGYYLASLFELI
jgi:drug/metabolite transporter (DMT)-like permease